MLHDEIHPDMDPDYRSRIFLARRRLIDTVESATLLPNSGLNARGLLDSGQMAKVQKIRHRRLATVIDRFTAD